MPTATWTSQESMGSNRRIQEYLCWRALIHDATSWQICLGDGAVSEINLDPVSVNDQALQFGARARSQDHGRRVSAQRKCLLAHSSSLGTADEGKAFGTMSGRIL